MVNENLKALNRLQIVLNVFLVALSFWTSYYIRFYTEILSPGNLVTTPFQTVLPLLIALPTTMLYYHLHDLFKINRHMGIFEALIRISKSNLYTLITIIAILFIFKINDFSRWTLLLHAVINTLLTTILYFFMIQLITKLYADESNRRSCLVVGTNEISESFLKNIEQNAMWGLNVIGVLSDESTVQNESKVEYEFNQYPVIGSVLDVGKKIAEYRADVVIIAIQASAYVHLPDIIKACEKAGVKTHIVPLYHKYVPAKPYMDDIDGLPVVDIRHVPLDNVLKSFMKRSFDIIFSLMALTIASPILLLSAILTKLTSPGPIIYKQERIGLNRKPFLMYKFRSMKVQDPSMEKTEWTKKNDPRKTKWGEFMRKTSIDELPQFINVLKGDMSVVGPRPERPFFVDKFKEEIPRYMIKHQVRPGITGWAQVSGWRGDTSIEKRIEHDLYYIENWTFAFDIKVILLTLFKGFINKNAY